MTIKVLRVLKSYGLGHTLDRVVRSIEKKTTDWPPQVEEKTHIMDTNGKGRTDKVFAPGWQKDNDGRGKAKGHKLSKVTPTETVIIQAAEGQKIRATVKSGQVWYHISNEKENEPPSTRSMLKIVHNSHLSNYLGPRSHALRVCFFNNHSPFAWLNLLTLC